MKKKTVKKTHVIMHELILPNDSNLLGNVLGGRVMHLMDMCAAMSAYKHARTAVVTASVDRLDFLAPVKGTSTSPSHITIFFRTRSYGP